MKIISIYPGHNATIGYYQDGVLEYVLQEEKFDNIKNSTGFPFKAMRYLGTQIDLKEVDIFITAGVPIFPELFIEDRHTSREDLE